MNHPFGVMFQLPDSIAGWFDASNALHVVMICDRLHMAIITCSFLPDVYL